MQEDNKIKKNTRNKKILVAITIFTLVTFNIVQLYIIRVRNNEADSRVGAYRQELQTMYERLEELSVELDRRINLIRHYGGRVDSLIEIQHQLEEERYALRYSGSLANKRYEDIRAKVQGYQALIEEKDREISLLDSAFQKLSQSRDTLLAQRDQMEAMLERLTLEKGLLEERISDASTISISGLEFTGINDRETVRANAENEISMKGIQELEVKVNIAPNRIAQPGQKTMYMTLLDPKGTIIASLEDGDAASFKFNGNSITYAAKHTFDYAPGERGQEEVVRFKRSKPLEPGKYAISVYCDNIQVGSAFLFVK